MMMDPSLYEDPKEFRPERFFERCAYPEAVRRSGYNEFDPESKVFGFGGRSVVALRILDQQSSLISSFVSASVQDASTPMLVCGSLWLAC